MHVSIIIPSYNAAAWLPETLASAFAQADTLAGHALQVIVVDDGSSDDSAAIVAHEFPQAELICTDHRGASHARNRGLERARGDWIQFLDADDLLAPGKIAAQLTYLEESGADVVYGDWQYLVGSVNDLFVRAQMVAREMHGTPEIALFTGFWAPLCAYLFRRRIVDAVGGFDVTLPIFQDTHFVLAAAVQGARFAHAPGISSYYRVHPGQISRNRAAFVRDGWTQFLLVQDWWQKEGALGAERRAALVQVLGNLARMSFEVDREIFGLAYHALEQLEPHYVPAAPRGLKYLSRLVGYPRAEQVAQHYRHWKRNVLGMLGRMPSEPVHMHVPRI